MKINQLLIIQYRRLWTQQRLFFIMLCLAQVVGIFIILFGSAAIQCVTITEKEIDTRSLQFVVRLNDGPAFDNETWKEIKNKVDYIVNQQPIPSLKTPVIYGTYQDHTFQIATMPASNEATVQINPSAFPSYAVGDVLPFGQCSYLITKLNSGLAYDVSIQGNELPADVLCSKVTFYYNEPPTTRQADEMRLLLAEAFPGSEIGLPETRDPLTAQFHAMTILCTILMLTFVIINISYVQMYRFRLEKRNFVLYRILGCTGNDIVSLCLMEVISLSLLLYTVSTVIFHMFFKAQISLWYEAVDSLYTIPYYAVLGCAYLVFQLIILALPLQNLLIQDINSSERMSI